MAAKVSTLSDLIQRVACTCLAHPLAHCRGHGQEYSAAEDEETEEEEVEEEEDQDEGASRGFRELEEGGEGGGRQQPGGTREAEALMEEVFQAVAALKRAYVSLQEAHCPWDPDRMSAADGTVVAELKRLGRLRDRFHRGWVGGGEGRVWTLTTAPPLREAVAPYEAALEELKRELKVKEAVVESLRDKLRGSAKAPVSRSESGRKGRFHRAGGRLNVPTSLAPQLGKPTPELFRTCMDEVRVASKSFTAHLLSLMRAARWDIAAAVRSIVEASTDTSPGNDIAIHGAADGAQSHPSTTPFPDVGAEHAKHALESYVNRKLFHGFENETFYMEGTLSSLLNPDQHRQECYSQYRDMRGMDPSELLGVLPGCHFGRFATKKYLAMVHPKMEESLFGGREQRRQVEAGAHPRTGFYGEFLRLAKAVWLLHLLAFALDPAPNHFEANQAAEFHPGYMESVVRFEGGRVPTGWVVGFPVAPGFKLGDGSIVRARVFLVARE